MQECCGEAFPDVMDYVVCEKCGTMFCEDCMNVYGLEDKEVTEESCPFCSGKEIDSDEFLNWLIEYKKKNVEQIGRNINMKTKPKFKIGEIVKSKTDLGMKLEVLRLKDKGVYYQYACLDTYGNTKEIHQTMLLKWDD